MLSHVTARTGEPVLILNGKLLASKFDPQAEAKKWVEKCAGQVASLAEASQVHFVLGAGSGQALLELAHRYPKAHIIAFTTKNEIITFWQEHFKNLAGKTLDADETAFSRISFYQLTTVEKFLESPVFFNVIEKTFVVLEHPSASVESSTEFKALKEALLGRSYGAFRTQAQHHKSYAELSQVLLPTIGALSIKNLSDALNLAQEVNPSSRSEILVLRELIK